MQSIMENCSILVFKYPPCLIMDNHTSRHALIHGGTDILTAAYRSIMREIISFITSDVPAKMVCTLTSRNSRAMGYSSI